MGGLLSSHLALSVIVFPMGLQWEEYHLPQLAHPPNTFNFIAFFVLG